jgi:hypothetical protein
MQNEKPLPRSWRVIAKELALEIDPVKARVLFAELNCAVRFIRYDGGDVGPLASPAKKPT